MRRTQEGTMLQIGMLAPEFPRGTLDENLDAMAAVGARASQFDLDSAVGATFPSDLSAAEIAAIRDGFSRRGLAIAALSGTVKMIHPDPALRARGLDDLKRLIPFAAALGTRVVKLCTGSRNPQSMWRPHPDNNMPEAWTDLLASVAEVIPVAEAHGITLGVEPEVANVGDSARKARRLLDEIASPHLKVIMDGANIYHKGELPQMRNMLEKAFA